MSGKYNCGPTITSCCTFYSGDKLTFLTDDNQLKCDATIDDVIKNIDAVLKKLIDGNDLTHLDVPSCFDFDPSTVTPATLHQIELNQICENTNDIASINDELNNFDIGSKFINITLPECLAGGSAPCAVGTNQYELISLITLFANMLCDHETRISNLES